MPAGQLLQAGEIERAKRPAVHEEHAVEPCGAAVPGAQVPEAEMSPTPAQKVPPGHGLQLGDRGAGW